ncbi:MAG: tetratricopeptide repeat protein [Bacteroides sp.]|nr:tetratricopeptide repeat protein [Prevotella sp.]MCM1407123.1 tetratricopeptide repeat protein [Treponema brennaborense]MCM1470275.1 tetratricopeptide repeat protein [Bacteroides sp.]
MMTKTKTWRLQTAACTAAAVLFASCASKTTVPPDFANDESSAAAVPQKTLPPEQEPAFTPENFISGVQASLSGGNISDTLALFADIPDEYKDDPGLNKIHASLLVSSGDLSAAADAGKKLWEQNPDDIDVLVLNAMIAKAQGNEKDKKKLLETVIKKDPQNTDACLELGHEQMIKRNFASARDYYRRSMTSDSSNTEAVFGYGQSSYYLGDLKEARKSFEKITEQDADFGLAYLYLGKLEVEKERYAAAAAYAEKAIACDDSYYDFWIDYGNYLSHLGRLAESEKALNRAVSLNPDNFIGYVYRAAVYDELGEFEKALADYRVIGKLNPSYTHVHEARGVDAWILGRWQEARQAFSAASNYSKDNISYMLMISASYIVEGKKAENKTFLDNIIRNMDRTSAEYAILRLYLDGYGPSAVEQKIRRVPSAAQKSKLLFYFALFHEINGDTQAAKKYYAELYGAEAPMQFEYRLVEQALK